MKMEAEGYA